VFADIDRWSSIALKEVSAAYYGEGRRVGLGFRTRFDADDTLRLSLIYAGSPADDAKLQRGDRVLAINNKTIDEIEAQDLWATVLGPEEEGVDVTMKIERLGGAVEDIAMEKRVYEFETTHTHRVFSHAGKTVGYLLFDRFLSTSGAELEAVFASFKQAGVDELVLDLRYNGGGLIDVAHHLGSLIAANPSEGELFTRVLHNDKHPDWNKDQLFIKQKNGLDLQRIFIIATGATASSSELLINGLFPHIEVRLIGEATYGKPVGSGAWTDCDLVIRPISFRLANAEGRADYFNGLSPDCFAEDDIDLPLGDETEASLAEALHFMSYGSCSLHAGPIDLAVEEGRARRTIPWRGLDAEIDAF
jgi:C-terminal processing protease CtpA/Prc